MPPIGEPVDGTSLIAVIVEEARTKPGSCLGMSAFQNVATCGHGSPSRSSVGDDIHVSGTCAPATHEKSDAYTQATAALDVIEKALKDAGAGIEHVVRTVVFLRDINDAEDVARAHLERFNKVRPASTLVQVTSMLRQWQRVEIEAYAKLGSYT